ncbi:MAG: family 16 glycoside hydrolase [Candidatus Shapirobacteria bacterium]
MNTINKFVCVVVFLILTFCSFSFSYGVDYFVDNFSGNLNNWDFVSGTVSDPNSWYLDNGVLVGSVGYGGSSYLYPVTSPNLISDFTLESDIMSISGVDINIFFRQALDKRQYYFVGFRSNDPNWSQDHNNIVFYRYQDEYSLLAKYSAELTPGGFDLTQNIWHKIKIVSAGKTTKVYYDGNLVINYYDSGTLLPAGRIALQNWGGAFSGQIVNKFDNFRISDGIVTHNKIIFLPGMGASWNEKAMVLNQTVAQSEWRMTPFVKNYDQMFKGFEDNGLIKNKDYFVYNFDWRKPLADQIIDFNNYVNGLGLGTGEKVDIVGHSFGGVIGRIWTQENEAKVGKIITLGSPNYGAVKVYDMWNGAKISDTTDSGSIALNVLLALQRKNKQTAVETIRSYAPALKDLLPTFNYLKKNGAIVTPPSNNYLNGKNSTSSTVFDKLLSVYGLGTNTKEWINLGDRNVFDTVLGQWEQGSPLNYGYTDGDGTVLKKSAIFEGDMSSQVTAAHGFVPNKSVNIVLTELGLGKTISTVADTSFNGAVFYMGSPALMKVNCGGEDLSESDGFILVPNRNISECVVKLVGTDNGVYHLVMGNSADDESWKYAEGNIMTGEIKNISVNMVDFWYEQMLRETNSLLSSYPNNSYLKSMKTAILAKNRNNLVSYYMLFRKSKLETIITWRMINYLEKIINIEVPTPTLTMISKQKNLALSAKSLTDKTAALYQRSKVNPNLWQSLNYDQGSNLLNNPNYAKYVLAEKIFGMVWY